MKPGQLQRNLSRLQAVAARARENIGRLEGEVAQLRELIAPNATVSTSSGEEDDIAAGNRTRTAPIAQGGVLFK